MTDEFGDDDRRAWIALASVDGIGLDLFWRLVAEFGRPSEVIAKAGAGDVRRWEATQHRGNLPLIPKKVLAELEALTASMDSRLAVVAEAGVWTITAQDANYPPRLRELNPAPPVIHGLGDASLLDPSRAVAVVGTRRPTAAGRLLASRVAMRLVELDAVVVSGVAIGVDGAAHAATLERGGRTIGVIGGGHLYPGPRAHERLRERIVAEGGALISEHHPSSTPTKGTYPRRNRVIAGLSDATIVIEAPAVSGASITAHICLELGRTLLVAPGRIGDWAAVGCLRLLRETPARPLIGLDEMVVDLGFDRPPAGADAVPTSLSAAGALRTLTGPQLTVAARLRLAPAGLDVLVDDTGLSPSVVSSAVTLLLMRGWIQSVGAAFLPAGPLLIG